MGGLISSGRGTSRMDLGLHMAKKQLRIRRWLHTELLTSLVHGNTGLK